MTATYELASKWGVEVEGDPDDLRNLMLKLNGSIGGLDDPFVSKLDQVVVLRCRLWDNLPNPGAVAQSANQDLRAIRSCLDVLDTCGEIKIGTIFEFLPANEINQTRDTEVTFRVKKKPSDWAPPDQFKALRLAAERHPDLQDAFSEYVWNGDWYSIYRCIEALIRHHGTEKKLTQILPARRAEILLMKRTTNSHRHVLRRYAPIANPMAISDARRLCAELLQVSAQRDLLSKALPGALPPGSVLSITDYQKNDGGTFGLKPLQLQHTAMEGEPINLDLNSLPEG